MRYLWAVAMCLWALGAGAQTLHFTVHALRGTAGEAATCLYEDRAGGIWLGTRDGLLFYDGIETERFAKADSTSNHVRAVFEDREGTLWVGYDDGHIGRLVAGRIEAWQPEEGTPAVPVTGIVQDTSGRMWFATYGEGLYYLDHNGRLYQIGEEEGMLGLDIYDLVADAHGRVWAATDGGINVCSVAGGRKRVRQLTRSTGLPDDIIRVLTRDTVEGVVWAGAYEGGIARIDESSLRVQPVDGWQDYGVITSLAVFSGYDVWVGTEDDGLWRYDLQAGQWHPATCSPAMRRTKVYALHRDGEGNLWVLNNTHGLCVANRQFELEEAELQQVQAVWAVDDDHLWVGTREGLFELSRDTAGHLRPRRHRASAPLNVISLYGDAHGVLWVGTFGQGLYLFDPATGRWRHLTEADGLTNDAILDIDGVNGHLWLATLGGVTEIALQGRHPMRETRFEVVNYNSKEGLGANFVYDVFIDSRGRTWFGTDGMGVGMRDTSGRLTTWRAVRTPAGDTLPLRTVYSIAEDRQGRMWFSTSRSGLVAFDGQHFRQVAEAAAERRSGVSSIMTDRNGRLLVVHAGGIELLDPQTGHVAAYDAVLGDLQLDPNLNALATDGRGHIWIADARRLVRYTALRERVRYEPSVRLTAISVLLQQVPFAQAHAFRANQNHIVFGYRGLWYTNPAAVRYRYRLEGYDLNWIHTSDRQATYSNLPSGKYVFRVQASHNGRFEGAPEAAWHFEIALPLWRRPWFIALALIAGVAGAVWYVRARDRRVQRLNLLEKEKVASQFEALKSQINPHFLFNSFNTLIALIEEEPDKAVHYVEKLSDFYRLLLQYRHREVISLQEEVELLQHYSYLLQQRFGDNFRLDLQVNGEAGFVPPLALQTLVENAVKHNIISKSKPLEVRIYFENRETIVVENNLQPKRSPEKSTGFGLQSLMRRYEMMQAGRVRIVKGEGKFRVLLPLILRRGQG